MNESAPGWAGNFLLYLLGLALFFLEVFIPSGGVIFLVACLLTLYALWQLFAAGYTLIASLSFLFTVAYAALLVRWTFRRVSMRSTLGEADAAGADVRDAQGLIGEVGLALSPLRPAGVARLQGRRLDVVSQSGFIERGAEVRVIASTGNRIVVRPNDGATPSEPAKDHPGADHDDPPASDNEDDGTPPGRDAPRE